MANCDECRRNNDCPGLDFCVHDNNDFRKDAERYHWLRANFMTDPRATGLHACETPDRLDAHIDTAIQEPNVWRLAYEANE